MLGYLGAVWYGILSNTFQFLNNITCIFTYLGPVWYMCLKTKNCCLKNFVEIRIDEKVSGNT